MAWRKWVLSIVLLLAACRRGQPEEAPVAPLTQAEADIAVAKLTAFLPERIGEFAASGPATSSVYLPESKIGCERGYTSGGRTLTVELRAGDVRAEMRIIAADEGHAFMSDSPTYWRTVDIKGRRARIAERRDFRIGGSEVYVRAGDRVTARLKVAPAKEAGESAELAAALDLDGIAAAGVAATGARR